MYIYETHLHTAPVSACATASVRENLEFYKSIGYAGVFITNHFIDGNLNIDKNNSTYEEKIKFYFSAYEEAKAIADEIGIAVFSGLESSFEGTDFLVYGLDEKWFLEHPEIETMKKSKVLPYYMKHGALVIQAHPFREAHYIDHIRLFPSCVHGVEVYNAGSTTEHMNQMAEKYADHYGLIRFSGSDNHHGVKKTLGGMQSPTPIKDEADFVCRVLSGEITVAPRFVYDKEI